MSKKDNIIKSYIVTALCMVFVLNTAISVSAAEMVEPAVIAQLEDSISVAGECNCVQDWGLMSRHYDRIDNSTHTVTSMYYSECMHGLKRKNEVTRENHFYKTNRDKGHVAGSQKHKWHVVCVCGDTESIVITCLGEQNGGAHAQP